MNNDGQDKPTGKKIRTIDTEIAEVYLRDDGIIVHRIFDGARLTLDQMKKVIKVIDELAEGGKRPFMVDGSVSFTMDNGVREYLASPQAVKNLVAIALVVKSNAMRLVSNLYLTLNKPIVPVRLFNSMEEGTQWLQRMDVLMGRKPR